MPTQEQLKVRFKSLKYQYRVALIITVVAFVWVFSGLIITPEQPPPETITAKNVPASVRVEHLNAEPKRRNVVLYGTTESNRQVTIFPQTAGVVKEIIAQEGKVIRQGEVILTLDEEDRKQRLSQATSLLKQRRIEYNAAKALTAKKLSSDRALAQAASALKSAEAEAKRAELELSYTTITAPFDGILEHIDVEVSDTVKPRDTPLATVIDPDPLLIVGQAAEKDANDFGIGLKGSARVYGHDPVEGRIRYVSKVADPKTRTFRIELEVPNAEYSFPEGVTAELTIATDAVSAHFIAPSSLALNKEGQMGVKVVENTNQVVFYPVTILDETPEGMWVTGLPEHIALITIGQAFVEEGTQVVVKEENKTE